MARRSETLDKVSRALGFVRAQEAAQREAAALVREADEALVEARFRPDAALACAAAERLEVAPAPAPAPAAVASAVPSRYTAAAAPPPASVSPAKRAPPPRAAPPAEAQLAFEKAAAVYTR